MGSGTVVVLGGAGFLGHHLCRAFAEAGADVIVFARTSATIVGTTTIALDLEDSRGVAEHLAACRPQAIVNAAGCTLGSPDEMRTANVELVRRLLAVASSVRPPPRLVQLGSAAEYGAGELGTSTDEDSQPRPAGPYGRSKLEATRQVLVASAAGQIDGIVLRVFNPVGAGMPAGSLLGRVCRHLAHIGAGRPLVVGHLGGYRDFVEVRDVAQAAVLAANASGEPRLVNVGSGRATLVRQAVEELIAISGVQVQLVESPDRLSPRSALVDWQRAEMRRAREQLGWAPRYDLSAALREAWGSP